VPARVQGGESDEALMARVAQGQVEAFDPLLRRYERATITFCYSFLHDRHHAEDVAQEVFLRVFRSAASYRPMAKFSTWLYKIAANFCINELKKRKLRYTRSLDEPIGSNPDGTRLAEKLARSTAPPVTKAERREAGRLLEEAITALPDEQRITLVLVEYHGLSYREIAEILEVTVSAVKMRVKRARENLRECLRILGGPPA